MSPYAIRTAGGATSFRMAEPDGSPPFPNAGETIVDTLEVPEGLPPYAQIDWTARQVLAGPVELESYLLAQIDARRAAVIGSELGTDDAKQFEYQRKGAEALSDVGPWLWLQREAEEKGVSIEDVRLGVLVAMDASEAYMRAVSAVAVAAKAAIRAADTTEAKQTAFDAIVWPGREGESA